MLTECYKHGTVGTMKRRNLVNAREFIQHHLDENGLGKLVAVVGPNRGGRNQNEAWWEIAIKYRRFEGQHHFDDGRIEVCIGHRNTMGYWNRRQIRLAIEREALSLKNAQIVKTVWTSAQRELTAGPGRNSSGAFEL